MLIMVVLIGGTGGTTTTDWPWKTNLANTGPTGWYHPAAPNPLEYHRYHQKKERKRTRYPHKLWIRFMWVTAERVREETHPRAPTWPR
jgi:hypothetical protein